MSPVSITLALLIALYTGSSAMPARAVESTGSAAFGDDGDSYRQAITDLESAQGAYATQLPEQLLGLGLSLQNAGQHEEAVRVFKRGVHLARVNDGL